MRCFLKHLWLAFYHEVLPFIEVVVVVLVISVFGYLGVQYLIQRFGEELVGRVWLIFGAAICGIMIGVAICRFIAWCIKTWKECKEDCNEVHNQD